MSSPLAAPRRGLGSRESVLLVLSVVVGVCGGLAAAGLRLLIRFVQDAAFGAAPMEPTSSGDVSSAWILLAPALGGLLVGPIVYGWSREARGSGVLEVIRAAQAAGGFVRDRVPFARMLATTLTLGLGGSAGQEGPIAQIGAGLGSVIGRRLGLRTPHVKVLAAAGVASGVAAAFNAPLAGAFFALEVVLGTFAMEHFAPIVLASVCGTLVTRSVFDGAASVQLPHEPFVLANPLELIAYVLLGCAAAVLAVGLVRLLAAIEDLLEWLPLHRWLRPALGGLAVGAVALVAPQVLGAGDDVMASILRGNPEVWGPRLLLVLLAAKLLATCLTVGSGGSGGMLSPSLFLGAILGALVGNLAGWLLPFETAPPGAYALVGMAAVAAGTSHAPISMVLMLFELTGDYGLIGPLLVSSAVAALLASRILPDSVFTYGLSRRGVRLKHGPEASLMLHDLEVEDVMRSHEAEVVAPGTPLSQVTARFLQTRTLHVYVVEEGAYVGTIHLDDVKVAFGSDLLGQTGLAIALDVVVEDVPTVTATTPLVDALDLLQHSEINELPVTRPLDDGRVQFLGTVSEHDILAVYNQEVLRKHALLARFVSHATSGGGEQDLHEDYFELPPGFAMAQIPVPAAMIGKTLAGADIRRRHDVNVLAMKVKGQDGRRKKHMPTPDYVLKVDDLIVVMGPVEGVEALRDGAGEDLADPEGADPEGAAPDLGAPPPS